MTPVSYSVSLFLRLVIGCCCGCFQRVHLDIQVGEHAVDYQQVAAKDKLTELQLRVRQLLDQVEQITKEQNYQRVRTIIACSERDRERGR